MKQLLILMCILFVSTLLSAQSPTGIKYQAILKGEDGMPLTERLVSLRFSALDVSNNVTYSETHAVMTGVQGLIQLNLGEGTPQSGSFSAIPWSSGEVAFRIEMDPNGGTNYTLSGEEHFQSVPYALFADMAGELADHAVVDPSQISSGGAATGQLLKWNGQNWVPADDIGGGGGGEYIAGPGISIVNNVITNTGDINPDDDITIISQAGGDLSGNFFNLQIRPGAVGSDEIAPGAINNTHIQLNSINETHIQGGTIPQSLPPNGPASGDLTGSYPAPEVRAIHGVPVTAQMPADGQVLKFNASSGQWQPGTDLVSTGGGAVNVSSRLLGDGSPGLPLDIASQGAQTGQVLKWNGSSWSPANDESGTGSPSGAAGGSLTGTYPNPMIANNAIGTQNIQNNAVVNDKVANATLQLQKIAQNNASTGQVIKWNGTSWAPANDNVGSSEPTGPAGGDLTGTYPNPQVGNNAINTIKLADGAVTTLKLADQSVTGGKIANASVTGAKIAQQGASTGQVLKWNGTTWAPANDEMGTGGGAPTGPAGGDLNGTYPNPTIANNAVTNSKISNAAISSEKLGDNAVTTSKIASLSVTDEKIASSAVSTEKIAGGAVTGGKIAQQGATTGQVLKWNGTTWTPANDEMGTGGGAPTGPAGGDLNGTYPNPSINNNAVTNSKIADSAVTGRKIAQLGASSGQFLMWGDTAWVAGNAPGGGGSPSGAAGGDLAGTYPNPVIADNAVTNSKLGTFSVTDEKIASSSVSAEKLTFGAVTGDKIAQQGASVGQVLKWNGNSWTPANDETGSGGLTLPYSGSATNTGAAFAVTQNSVLGTAIQATRGSNVARLGTSSYAGDFAGTIRVQAPAGVVPIPAAEFEGHVNISGGVSVSASSNPAISIVSSASGSRLNLNNNNNTWSIVNESSLRFNRDNQDVVSIVYPGSLFNSAALRPAINNELSLGTSGFRWTSVFATNGTINTSDRNLKKNMVSLKYGLKDVLKLNPVSYQWIENIDDDRTHLGFIAQEVEQIIPEVIVKSEEGSYGMNYAELVPVLVNAIQELTKKVGQLETELHQVKAVRD